VQLKLALVVIYQKLELQFDHMLESIRKYHISNWVELASYLTRYIRQMGCNLTIWWTTPSSEYCHSDDICAKILNLIES